MINRGDSNALEKRRDVEEGERQLVVARLAARCKRSHFVTLRKKDTALVKHDLQLAEKKLYSKKKKITRRATRGRREKM